MHKIYVNALEKKTWKWKHDNVYSKDAIQHENVLLHSLCWAPALVIAVFQIDALVCIQLEKQSNTFATFHQYCLVKLTIVRLKELHDEGG